MSLQDLIKKRHADGFVGRQTQLEHFQNNLLLPVDDLRRRFVFSVHGDSGVGKSFLMLQFIRLAQEQDYATASTDESVLDIPTAMQAMAAGLKHSGSLCKNFTQRFEIYRNRRGEVDKDPQVPEGLSSVLARSAIRVGVRAAGEIPVVGSFAKELDADALAKQADRFRAYLNQKLRNRHDVQLLLSPIEVLTPVFVSDLRAIAKKRGIALFFDTYEHTSSFLDQWLVGLLGGRYGELPPKFLLTTAGQHPLDINAWSDYLGIRSDIPLEVFSEDEARELLASRGVTDEAVVDVILGLTGRLPVLVAMLAEARPQNIEAVDDPSNNAVKRFLRWAPDDRLRSTALHGALPRRLDQETCEAATGSTSIDDAFTWLCQLPFVSEHADGYRYHDVVRKTMIRVQRRRSPADWRRRHSNLAAHYQSSAASLGLTGRSAWKDSRWQGLTLEEHYHRLCFSSVDALPPVLAAVVDSLHMNPESVPRWTAMVEQAGRDSGDVELVSYGKKLAELSGDQVQGRLAVLATLANNSTLSNHHRATASAQRGMLHCALERFDGALADFELAMQLDPNQPWIAARHGDAYLLMKKYEDAISHLTRAIDLDSEYSWAIAERAEAYRLLGQYHDAIADCDRVLGIDSQYVLALATRGQAACSVAQHENALADFNRAIDLKPDYVWALVQRGQLLCRLGQHKDGLVDFSRALDLDPRNDWAFTCRGLANSFLDRHTEALDDLNSAVELRPDNIDAIVRRGHVHQQMSRYDEALKDVSLATKLAPGSIPIARFRGRLLRTMKRHEEAITEFNRALQLAPDEVDLIEERGETFFGRGDHEEALADFDRIVEIDPDYVWALTRRSRIYHLLGKKVEAMADLDQILELDVTEGWDRYQIHLVAHALDQEETASAQIRKALTVERAAISEFPRDGWRALNIAIYHLAMGDELLAERQLQAAFAHHIYIAHLHDAVVDFRELEGEMRCTASRLIELLEAEIANKARGVT